MTSNSLYSEGIFNNIGKTIFGLKFNEVIGKGTHGIVYKTIDLNTRRYYAVKMIIPSRKKKNGLIKHMPYYEIIEAYNEVNIMSHISHPYIANYRQKFIAHTHFKDKDIQNIKTLFIIMDIADCSMKDIILSKV